MKIQIDNEVRDMTEEEVAEMEDWRKSIPAPISIDDATVEDYENALAEMGVDFSD